ncbi:MAG TPA: MarR family transcriptional regulator [Egibacteraceae bacterium]|jgi:DNA-binding MarR family transcriptional regulator|nr:MarR family transcriptional regulator [Egibacteraceae bacterium]
MSDTRWLSPEEQSAWRAFLNASQLVAERLERQLQRDCGMPHAYYEILVHLSEASDRTMRMSALARCSRYSPSRLSHAVARLEAAGWVRREDCPSDARGQLAVLTDEGFARLAAAAPGHVQEVRSVLFDALTADEVAQLRTTCEAILRAAGDRTAEAPKGASQGSAPHDPNASPPL